MGIASRVYGVESSRGVQGGGGANQHVSNNELDYKTHVLYVLLGDKPSQLALEKAAKNNEIHIVNIKNIPVNKRPGWLAGTPTLVDLQTNQIYTGSQALRCLDQACTAGLAGANGNSGIGYDINTLHNTSKSCTIEPIVDDEQKYSNTRPKVKDEDINRLMQRRSTLPPVGTASSTKQLPPANVVHTEFPM